MKKEILYFDMDGVLVDYSSGITQISPEAQKEYQGRLFEVPGVFSLMKPLDGGIDAFETLSKVYDAYIFFQRLLGIIRVHGLISMTGYRII